MGRKILAVVVAMITASGIIWVTFMIGTMMAPFYPKNLEYMGQAEVQAYANGLPTSTFAVDLAGCLVAAFFAGFISTKMGRRWGGGSTLAFICGVLMIVAELISVAFWPQPLWFVIASVVLFIPAAMIGYKFAHRVGHTHVATAA
jgi:MFS family permease